MDTALEFSNPNYTSSSFLNDSVNHENVSEGISSDPGRRINYGVVILSSSILVICIVGAVGNGMVIWLLGFCIKRTPFIIYILNLAIADFGFLLSVIFAVVDLWVAFPFGFPILFYAFMFLFLSMYSTSQFLLTVISIDRCVAVFSPLWHRCQRPRHSSTIVCALVWALSICLTSINCILMILDSYETKIGEAYQFIVNALLCLPAMTGATLALLIKLCFKAQQHQRGKLLTIILLTLLFFLLFAFPLNVISIVGIYSSVTLFIWQCITLLASLNSSINPVIYFLVGRQWKSRQRETMKMIIQKVFKENEACIKEAPIEIQL